MSPHGRALNRLDAIDGLPALVVNETLAREHLGGVAAVGQRCS